MTVRFQMDLKGMAEYLEQIVQAGRDVDAAAAKAVAAGGDVVHGSMLDKVPVLSGNLKSKLERTEPTQEGNFISVEVGMSKNTDADTAIYGNVQEYGSATNPAQPYIRPSFDENKAKVRAAEKAVLQEEGFV
jgi:HK97 gp10 family phage protein